MDKVWEKYNLPTLFGPTVPISEEEFEREFMNFISKYRRSYDNSNEFNYRYEVFRRNYQQIMDMNTNAEKNGFELGVNEFADLTLEEFADTRLGLKDRPRRRTFEQQLFGSMSARRSKKSDLPETVDWRTSGEYVNPVKNQGTCGSCWAFSTIGSVESAFAIKTGKLPQLSEQQLVQCSKGFGNGGCSGGFMEYAFKYAETYPLCTEDEYPYEGKDSTGCVHQKCLNNPYKLSGFKDIDNMSRESLYTALTKQPVSIGVCAGNIAWQFYKKGVMKRFCGDCLDHGVVTVGYGTKDGDHIIVRNSWGPDWGENGYLRISSKDQSGKGTCGIYQLPSIPIIEEA
jgi:cathepsin L